MRSRFYTHDGITQTLGEWCRHFNVPYLKTYMRIHRGMSFLDAIHKPDGSLAKPRKPAEKEILITHNGKTQSLHAWTTELGVPYLKTLKRIKRGWDPLEALTTPGRVVTPGQPGKRLAATMIGAKFGRLTVTAISDIVNQTQRWKCVCECGQEMQATTNTLRGGHTRSCGCIVNRRIHHDGVEYNLTELAASSGVHVSTLARRLQRGWSIDEATKTAPRMRSTAYFERSTVKGHGRSDTSIYKIWNALRQRCNNPKNHAYARYGGRGIGYDPRWDSFEVFLADMGEKPDGYTLDRTDNDEGYFPDNCRWVDSATQNRNQRSNRWIEIDGRRQILADWCRESGVDRGTVFKRLGKGWSFKDAIFTPKKKRVSR